MSKIWKWLTKKRYVRECPQGGHEQVGSLYRLEYGVGYCRELECVHAMVIEDLDYLVKTKRNIMRAAVSSYALLSRHKGISPDDWYDEFGNTILRLLEECEA